MVLAAPATAWADSIVFVKEGDVWLANPDGSGQYQVTLDGTPSDPYRSPSQADSGLIAAGHGLDLVTLRQNGQELSRFDPDPLMNSVSHPQDGPPVDVAISPDGSRIAYTMYGYACPVAAECGGRSVTGYTSASTFTAAGDDATYLREPSWVTNSRTLQFNGFGSQVNFHDVGAPRQPDDDGSVHWFDDSDVVGMENSTDLADGELSSDGMRFAAVRGYDATAQIAWYSVSGNAKTGAPPPPPTPLCETNQATGFAAPTWSPDGESLAWREPDGIWVKTDANACDVQPALVIPGGDEPDWGPAAINPGPRQPTGPGPNEPSAGGKSKRAKAIARCKKIKPTTKKKARKRAKCLRKARKLPKS